MVISRLSIESPPLPLKESCPLSPLVPPAMSQRPPIPEHGERGFSLIELMVAMTLGLILLVGTMTMFGVTIRANTELLSTARLNGELGSVASIMSNDIRRAGYSNGLVGMFPPGYDLSIPAAGCVLYSYDLSRNKIGGPNEDDNGNGALDAGEDLDEDGALDTGDDAEWFGFRYISSDGSIWMRQSCTDTTDANCVAAASCVSSPAPNYQNWEQITDPKVIRVTGVTLTTTGSKCINVSNNEYWVTTDTTATTFPCPTAAGGTAPAGTTGYLFSSGSYSTGTPTAVASGNNLVEVRQVNLAINGCIKDPRDTNNNCVVDGTEDFPLYSSRQEMEIKVRNDFIRRIP